jgi:hypothetical protein
MILSLRSVTVTVRAQQRSWGAAASRTEERGVKVGNNQYNC